MTSILSLLPATDEQHRAVTVRGTDVAVTAGAGSGKTRALVGRYLSLLEDGLAPHSVVAITFTEKAAREMRTRIRRLIQRWLTDAPEDVDRSRWEDIYTELDAAPIGTIHSLCAKILRTHPAEAGLDPAFSVLDEGIAAALRAQAVESVLVWGANDPEAAGLFPLLTENGLRQSVAALLDNRLDAAAAFDAAGADPLARWRAAIQAEIAGFVDDPAVQSAVADLEALRAEGTLTGLAGDKLAVAIGDFLSAWGAIASAWKTGDLSRVLQQLPEARRAMLPHLGRQSDWSDISIPREALTELRSRYDATLGDLLKNPVDWTLDAQAAEALTHLRAVFDQARDAYIQAKEQRRALDFDDLEAGAVALLEGYPEVRAYWHSEIDAVLVDEFQDTNDRQRRIVYALTGLSDLEPMADQERTVGRQAKLFVVGDAKQSIYRFRGADVTVFRDVQRDVEAAGGEIVDLDLTFRAHEPLLQQLNALLGPVMGTERDAGRPYLVPFTPLQAYRPVPEGDVREPYVEFCLGLGDFASDGRPAAASALARRLWSLHDSEGVGWGDVGLLFRASTGFADYEDALEEAGIPYVTVAGRGFYDRPEVRDVLNALRAIADPTDDRAMAGLLRSPAFALTDGALYLLRRGEDGTKRGLWAALRGDLSMLNREERSRAQNATKIVTQLNNLVGRITVAQVLGQFLNLTHYRAILRYPADDEAIAGGGERARRNVDKLLADAHASRLISVGEFLEYLQTLRDVAAREGEAPVEAGDAVQLMTVHKAKGLEFSVVVIADAGYAGGGRTPRLLLDAKLGPVIKLEGDDGRSVVHRLAALRDAAKDEAEERRLLYVAATRAMDKLLISGHVKASTAKKHPGKLLASGWLGQLGQVVGLDQVRAEEPLEKPISVDLRDVAGGRVGCTISPLMTDELSTSVQADGESQPTAVGPREPSEAGAAEIEFPPALVKPVFERSVEVVDEAARVRGAESPPRVWRVAPTAERPRGPARVVGVLAHEALSRWRFPGDDGFEELLRLRALEAGLIDETEIKEAVGEARRLLSRFQEHPLYAEIDASRCYHEVPYTIEFDGQVQSGQIDVVYQHAGRWHIVDFKTDEIRSKAKLYAKAEEYRRQIEIYVEAVRQLLDTEPEARLCFLNVAGDVRVVPVSPKKQGGL